MVRSCCAFQINGNIRIRKASPPKDRIDQNIRTNTANSFRKNIFAGGNGILPETGLRKPPRDGIIEKIGYRPVEQNRKNSEYIDLHNKNITDYCKKWDYEYLFTTNVFIMFIGVKCI